MRRSKRSGKVSLVQPLHADQRTKKAGQGGFFKPPQLTMPYLAACTPPEFEVEIHDEIAAPLELAKIDGDIVGITAVTPFAPRAYKLARELRANGQTVIMGGPHASILPEEVSQHVDAVVVGEGDLLWPQALQDWQRGELRSIYRNEKPPPLENLPFPRWDLLQSKNYIIPQVVQATRGCPYSCDFCSLKSIFPGYRTRPVRDVVREIERAPFRHVVLWDDNIIGDPAWAKQLFRELRPLKKKWYSQATITIARSRELVRLAGKSGCSGLFIGLESFSSASLRGTKKGFNRVEQYQRDIKLLSDHGIMVMSGLVFGFDEDTPDIFQHTLEQSIALGLSGIANSILTPYPGTALFARLQREGRITTYDWSRYTSDEVVIKPRQLTAEQLIHGHNWVGQQFHRYQTILLRWWRTRFIQPQVFWLSNLANRRYFNAFEPASVDPAIETAHYHLGAGSSSSSSHAHWSS